MKKRKGLFLLEALLALLILASLAAALFPLAGQAAKAEILASVRGKLENQGLFAMDFMVEKIRNNRHSAAGGVRGNSYDYRDFTARGTEGTYRFFVDREKLKLRLYNDNIQPLTGEYTGPEAYAFLPGRPSLFRQVEGGPVIISFTMHHQMMGMDRDFETSVIPYADFYKKKEVYE